MSKISSVLAFCLLAVEISKCSVNLELFRDPGLMGKNFILNSQSQLINYDISRSFSLIMQRLENTVK